FFVRLDHIRKCFTQKGGIFVLEEYNPKTRQVIQRKYKSSMMSDLEDFDHVFGIRGEEEFDRVYQRIQLEEQENRRNIACHRRVCIR
ncbi:hypothetical protein L9F63_027099, partial [Diploptera punctata]